MFNCSCHHYCFRCTVQLSQPHHVIKYSEELEEFLQKPIEEVIEKELEQINIEVEEPNNIIEDSSNVYHDYFTTHKKRKHKKQKHHKKYVSDSESTSADEASSDLEPQTLAYIDDLYSKPTAATKANVKEKFIMLEDIKQFEFSKKKYWYGTYLGYDKPTLFFGANRLITLVYDRPLGRSLIMELGPIFDAGGEDTYYYTRSNWSKNKKALVISQRQAELTIDFYLKKFPQKTQFLTLLKQKIQNPSAEVDESTIPKSTSKSTSSPFTTPVSNGTSALGRKRKKTHKFATDGGSAGTSPTGGTSKYNQDKTLITFLIQNSFRIDHVTFQYGFTQDGIYFAAYSIIEYVLGKQHSSATVIVPPILKKYADDKNVYFAPLKAVKNRSVLVLSQSQALTVVDHYKIITPISKDALNLLRDKLKNLIVDVAFEFEAAKKMANAPVITEAPKKKAEEEPQEVNLKFPEILSFKIKDVEIHYGISNNEYYFSAADICSIVWSNNETPENIFDILREKFITDKASHYVSYLNRPSLYLSFYQTSVAIDYFAHRRLKRKPAQSELLNSVKNKISQLSGKTLPVSVPEPDSPPPKKTTKSKKSRTSNVRDYVNVEFTSKILSFPWSTYKIHYAFKGETPYFLAKDLLNVFYGTSFTMGAPSVFVPVLNKLGENSTMYCSSLLSKKKALILEKSQVLAVLDKFVSKFPKTSDYEKFKQLIMSRKATEAKKSSDTPTKKEKSPAPKDFERWTSEDEYSSSSSSDGGQFTSDEEDNNLKEKEEASQDIKRRKLLDAKITTTTLVASPPISIASSSEDDEEDTEETSKNLAVEEVEFSDSSEEEEEEEVANNGPSSEEEEANEESSEDEPEQEDDEDSDGNIKID